MLFQFHDSKKKRIYLHFYRRCDFVFLMTEKPKINSRYFCFLFAIINKIHCLCVFIPCRLFTLSLFISIAIKTNKKYEDLFISRVLQFAWERVKKQNEVMKLLLSRTFSHWSWLKYDIFLGVLILVRTPSSPYLLSSHRRPVRISFEL